MSRKLEARVWAFTIVSLVIILMVSAVGMVYSVAFEEQIMQIAPIDERFLDIIEKVMFMIIGVIGGLAGRSFGEEKKDDSTTGTP
jgi:H+/Cl- antiporter ClcA